MAHGTDNAPQWEFERPSFELASLPGEWLLKIREWAARETPIEAIYLFGSRATGCYRDNSDVDLAVLLDDKISSKKDGQYWANNHQRIKRDLNALLHPIRVDVRAMFRDADFMSCVRRHGIRIYLKRQP